MMCAFLRKLHAALCLLLLSATWVLGADLDPKGLDVILARGDTKAFREAIFSPGAWTPEMWDAVPGYLKNEKTRFAVLSAMTRQYAPWNPEVWRTLLELRRNEETQISAEFTLAAFRESWPGIVYSDLLKFGLKDRSSPLYGALVQNLENHMDWIKEPGEMGAVYELVARNNPMLFLATVHLAGERGGKIPGEARTLSAHAVRDLIDKDPARLGSMPHLIKDLPKETHPEILAAMRQAMPVDDDDIEGLWNLSKHLGPLLTEESTTKNPEEICKIVCDGVFSKADQWMQANKGDDSIGQTSGVLQLLFLLKAERTCSTGHGIRDAIVGSFRRPEVHPGSVAMCRTNPDGHQATSRATATLTESSSRILGGNLTKDTVMGPPFLLSLLTEVLDAPEGKLDDVKRNELQALVARTLKLMTENLRSRLGGQLQTVGEGSGLNAYMSAVYIDALTRNYAADVTLKQFEATEFLKRYKESVVEGVPYRPGYFGPNNNDSREESSFRAVTRLFVLQQALAKKGEPSRMISRKLSESLKDAADSRLTLETAKNRRYTVGGIQEYHDANDGTGKHYYFPNMYFLLRAAESLRGKDGELSQQDSDSFSKLFESLLHQYDSSTGMFRGYGQPISDYVEGEVVILDNHIGPANAFGGLALLPYAKGCVKKESAPTVEAAKTEIRKMQQNN